MLEADCLIISENKNIGDFVENIDSYVLLFDMGYGKIYEKAEI